MNRRTARILGAAAAGTAALVTLRELKKVRHRKEEERQAAIDAALVRNRDYGSRRAYLIGGGWKDYCATGCVCGIKLPEGLQMGQKLPEPIFTPAAKAEVARMTKTSRSNASSSSTARKSPRRSAATRSSSIAAPPNTPPRRASLSPTRSSSSALTRKAPSA